MDPQKTSNGTPASPEPTASPEPSTQPTGQTSDSSSQTVFPPTPSTNTAAASNIQQPGVAAQANVTTPPVASSPKPGKSKLILLAAGLAALLIGGSAAAYFGYFVPNKPENIWASAMDRTGKSIESVIADAKKGSGKGSEVSGKFQFGGGGIKTDGKFTVRSDNKNSVMKADFAALTSRVDIEVRSIDSSSSDYPDVYIKAKGIKGVAPLLTQSPTGQRTITDLDDQWIEIDHTFISKVMEGSSDTTGSGISLSSEKLLKTFEALNKVNREYLFTNDSGKAVFKVVKNVGRETRDDRSVYHYKVALDKQHTKKYLKALNREIEKSPAKDSLGDAFSEAFIKPITELAEELDRYDESADLMDVYVDTSTKMLHAIRITDKDNDKSYIELGVQKTKDKQMPFVMKGVNNTDNGSNKFDVSLSYDSKKRTWSGEVKAETIADEDKSSLELNVDVKRLDDDLKVEKPDESMPIEQIIQQLYGLGDSGSNSPYSSPGSSSGGGSRYLNGGLLGI